MARENPLRSPKAAEIDTLLAEALDQPAGPSRQAFLDTACADDEDLRREVELLLAAAAETDTLLRPGGAIGRSSAAADLPRQLGPYQLLREIGQGGMGTVYLAERADGHYEQQVAVKVLRLGADRRSLARFHRERQILARLEHSAIARLYDGGTTPHGDPYLVMEHVEGELIDRYCGQRDLSLRQRLDLFIAVCEALQTAHRQLVVHQDIKPANILVSGEGEVKLLDFGIATLIDEDSGVTGPGATITSRPLTPQYASPEQIENRVPTVSSDIYQLGLLAYELLTGRRPYVLDSSSVWRWKEQICLLSPPAPSAALAGATAADGVSAPSLAPAELLGDLDAIVLKCLRKEPERRYGSVDLLLQDLKRRLEGRPVSARPDTWRYRVGKFLGRHRAAVSATLLVSLAFLVLTAAFIQRLTAERNRSLLSAEQAIEERIRAERHSRDAEMAVGFLVDLFSLSDPYSVASRKEPLSAQQLLDLGAERLGHELTGQPRVRARLLSNLGRIFFNLGRLDRAGDLAGEVLSMSESSPDISPDVLGGSLRTLGRIAKLGGELDRARERFIRALELIPDDTAGDNLNRASILNDLGGIELNLGNYDASRNYYQQAHDLYVLHRGADSADVGTILQNIAVIRHQQGDWDEAEELYQRALAVFEKSLREDHPSVGNAVHNLAILESERGNPAGAVASWERLLNQWRESLGADHPKIVMVLHCLAMGHMDLGNYDAADQYAGQVLELQRSRYGTGHHQEADILVVQGDILLERGRLAEAEALVRQALELYRPHLPARRVPFGMALNSLGEILLGQGRDQEAEEIFTRSLEHLEEVLGPQAYNVDLPALNLARILHRRGQTEQAEGLYRRALEIRAGVLPRAAEKRGEAARAYAGLLRELGRDQEASTVMERLAPPL